jgi:hypothetical protein
MQSNREKRVSDAVVGSPKSHFGKSPGKVLQPFLARIIQRKRERERERAAIDRNESGASVKLMRTQSRERRVRFIHSN